MIVAEFCIIWCSLENTAVTLFYKVWWYGLFYTNLTMKIYTCSYNSLSRLLRILITHQDDLAKYVEDLFRLSAVLYVTARPIISTFLKSNTTVVPDALKIRLHHYTFCMNLKCCMKPLAQWILKFVWLWPQEGRINNIANKHMDDVWYG